MKTTNTEAIRTLVREARKLDLIDSWTMSEAYLILSKDAVTYRISFADAVRFLRSLIRSTSGHARIVDAA